MIDKTVKVKESVPNSTKDLEKNDGAVLKMIDFEEKKSSEICSKKSSFVKKPVQKPPKKHKSHFLSALSSKKKNPFVDMSSEVLNLASMPKGIGNSKI